MLNVLKKIMLSIAVCSTLGLSACLPDNTDPDKAANAGQLSGTFYANGLGSVALAIQNAVVTSSNWFAAMGSDGLNLAALGVSSQGLGVPVKSFVCNNASGSGVLQITWIDARDGSNKFALRGIGSDAGSIVSALRNRVSGNQIGVFNGSSIVMANGTSQSLPSGCAAATIPNGAPVLAFAIETPAPPTQEMVRTEYRTTPCGADETGRQMRGTQVQSRIVRYLANGTMAADAWSTDIASMGQCMNDAVVELGTRNFRAGAGTVNMNNFAAIALRDLLQGQLQMDCVDRSVNANMARSGQMKRSAKTVDTCPLMAGMAGMTQGGESDTGDGTDTKILQCKGQTPLMYKQFVNLMGQGLQTTAWTRGTATLLRTLDNKAVDDRGQQAKRYKWTGTDINCGGYQTFYAGCGIIPGNPTPYAQRASNKFTISPITGYRVHRSWLNKVFGVCFLGSCVSVEGGEVYNLNPDYFSGVDNLQNGGTTTYRTMGVFDLANPSNPQNWINNEKFLPYTVPKTIWRINDNQCLWRERVMIANCPFYYDPTMQGDWTMTHISASNARPVAIDPGIPSDGSDTGTTYAQVRAEGHMVAQVVLHWKKKNIKGTKRWDETFGPGLGAYIKSWSGVPVTDIVTLTAEQTDIRNESCENVAYQLNAYNIMTEKQGIMQQAQVTMNNMAAIRNNAQAALTAASANVTTAKNNLTNLNAQIQGHYNNATYWENAADHAWDSYNSMANANAEYDRNFNPSCNTKGCTQPVYSPPYSSAQLDQAAANASYYAGVYEYNANLETDAARNKENQRPSYQAAINNAENAEAGAQASFNAAQAELNTASTRYNDANTIYLAAKQVNDQHLVNPLTSEELNILTEYQGRVCTSASGTLDLDSQQNYKQACIGYYDNPQPFSKVQSIGLFCDATFNRSGENLSFKISSNSFYSDNVQTTLLNTEGVHLAWRPVLEGNRFAGDESTTLVTRQRGFTDPLMCARSEYRYIQWPVTEYYWQCGGKGGCRQAQRSSSCTIIESTAREWSGLSYETGTWSRPETVCITPWGTYGSCSQLPNPYSTWSSGCTLPVTAPPVAAPPPPPATSPPQSSGMSCTDECGETKSDGATWCRAGVNGIGHGRRCSNGVIEELTGVSGLGCDAGGTFQCQ